MTVNSDTQLILNDRSSRTFFKLVSGNCTNWFIVAWQCMESDTWSHERMQKRKTKQKVDDSVKKDCEARGLMVVKDERAVQDRHQWRTMLKTSVLLCRQGTKRRRKFIVKYFVILSKLPEIFCYSRITLSRIRYAYGRY